MEERGIMGEERGLEFSYACILDGTLSGITTVFGG